MMYRVMRDCCTSGNCVTCMHLPLGKKMRVSQMGATPLTKERAEKIAANWKSYAPTVEPVTAIEQLEEQQ